MELKPLLVLSDDNFQAWLSQFVHQRIQVQGHFCSNALGPNECKGLVLISAKASSEMIKNFRRARRAELPSLLIGPVGCELVDLVPEYDLQVAMHPMLTSKPAGCIPCPVHDFISDRENKVSSHAGALESDSEDSVRLGLELAIKEFLEMV